MILIDNFPIDASLKEGHNWENEITDLPIESGGNFTDHSKSKPRKVTIEAVVSNTPIGTMALLRDLEGEGPGNQKPSDEALAKLEELDRTKRAVTLVTAGGVYENMMLETLEITKEPKKEGGLWFTSVWKKVTIIKNQVTRVAAPPLQKKTNVGPKTPKAGKPPEYRKVDTGDGTWYDPDIGGWRYSAVYSKEKGKYIFYKGIAVGFDELLSDAEYKRRIQNKDSFVGKVYKDNTNPNSGRTWQIITDPKEQDAIQNDPNITRINPEDPFPAP